MYCCYVYEFIKSHAWVLYHIKINMGENITEFHICWPFANFFLVELFI